MGRGPRTAKESAIEFLTDFLFHLKRVMPSLLQGALIAIVVVICAEVIGTTVGLLLALCRLAKTRWLSWPALVYVDVIRGTPMLVQILIAYFGVPGLVMSDHRRAVQHQRDF